jgi:hypothetical protein
VPQNLKDDIKKAIADEKESQEQDEEIQAEEKPEQDEECDRLGVLYGTAGLIWGLPPIAATPKTKPARRET